MRTTLTILSSVLLALVTLAPAYAQAPEARIPQSAAAVAEVPPTNPNAAPLRVRIPAIGLNDPIQNMGLDKLGNLSVPSGKTQNVGWWQGGTIPGHVGSAVFDAHVFAAFKHLASARVGDDIYVDMSDGTTRHFQIQSSQVYKLAYVPANTLYNRADTARLNLITCAGTLTADHSTYTHRLVAYAVLVS
ncbi:MAG: class F sortase [Patescibacteria group bacterium]|nr:class F sortase [Patescibacteria group bacterium]